MKEWCKLRLGEVIVAHIVLYGKEQKSSKILEEDWM